MSVLKAGDGGRRGEEHAAQANKRIKGRGPAPRPDAFSAPVFLLPGGCWLPPGMDEAKWPDGRREAGARRPTRGALAARGEPPPSCSVVVREDPLQRSEILEFNLIHVHDVTTLFQGNLGEFDSLRLARNESRVDGCDL